MIARLAATLAVPIPALLSQDVAVVVSGGVTPTELHQHSNTEPVVEAVGGSGEEAP
jgi:hypothetical protein